MSAHSEPRLYAFFAEADLSAKQFTFVKFGAADNGVVNSGAGEAIDGIMQDAPATGEAGAVALPGGGAKLKLGGTVTRGQFIKSGAAGVGVAATANLEIYGAKAMASGVSGDVIPVEVVTGQMSLA